MTAGKTRSIKTITADFARELVEASVRKADEIGVPMVISVVDHAGALKGFLRMDGAPLLSVDISQNKAYTAAAFGISTGDWYDFIKEDDPLRISIVHTDRLVTFGGGYPIKIDGELIGAIGVSGGHYTEDMQVAAAALESAGLSTL